MAQHGPVQRCRLLASPPCGLVRDMLAGLITWATWVHTTPGVNVAAALVTVFIALMRHLRQLFLAGTDAAGLAVSHLTGCQVSLECGFYSSLIRGDRRGDYRCLAYLRDILCNDVNSSISREFYASGLPCLVLICGAGNRPSRRCRSPAPAASWFRLAGHPTGFHWEMPKSVYQDDFDHQRLPSGR